MAVRGVYSKEEEAILADFKDHSNRQIGWLNDSYGENGQPVRRVATKEAIENWGIAADYWNPLWHNDSYARNTGWGGIIAFPFFQHYLLHGGPQVTLNVPAEVGSVRHAAYGDHWEFYTPIRAGDTFRMWIGPAKIEDVSSPDGKSPRQFKILDTLEYINQRDEITGIFHRYNVWMIVPPKMSDEDFIFPAGNPAYLPDLQPTKDSSYTKEEITAINRIAEAEEIRGATPRYWEDVNVGDKLKPITQGPLTLWDAISNIQSFGLAALPVREVLRRSRPLIDPDTNIPYFGAEWHLSSQVAKAIGQNSSSLLAVLICHFLGRLVTNWMGDEGFLVKFEHRKTSNNPYGDTLYGSGKVINKYRGDNGSFLVDIAVEMETNRGIITNVAIVTVTLPSKERTVSGIRQTYHDFNTQSAERQDITVEDFKVGDRVRVKERPDWWLPTEYKPAGMEGIVAEVLKDAAGQYIAVLFNKVIVGMDKRIPLAFRIEAVKKI